MAKKIIAALKRRAAMFNIGIRIGLAYKFEFIIGLLTTPISLFIFYFLWKSIYAYSGMTVIRGYDFPTLVNYFVLSMLVGYFTWSEIDNWLEHMVVHGEMVTEMTRPIKFITQELWFDWGMKSIALATQAVPLIIGAQLIIGVTFISFGYTLLAIVSLGLAMMMTFLISALVGFSAFWLNRISGIRRVKRGLLLLLTGGMIPLSFFPVWFITASNYLPFQYMRYVPINIYLGQYTTTAAGFGNLYVILLVQIVWTLLLYISARKVWTHAFKKFAAAGL